MAACITSIRRWAIILRDFAASGQLLNLAVAIIIGNAFTKVIEALVDNLLTPVLGFLFDGTDITDLKTTLKSDRWSHKAPVTVPYGIFLKQLIYFALIIIILTLLITIINSIFKARRRNLIHTEQLPTKQELILMEHTNLLKSIAESLKQMNLGLK